MDSSPPGKSSGYMPLPPSTSRSPLILPLISPLTIAEAAQRSGLSAYTLRYYERIGLLESVGRASGGQRRYAPADMEWLAFLGRLRATGMSIRQMQAFARLRAQGEATVAQRRALLEQHWAEVQARVSELMEAGAVLGEKIAHYRRLEQAAGAPSHGQPCGASDESSTLSTGEGAPHEPSAL